MKTYRITLWRGEDVVQSETRHNRYNAILVAHHILYREAKASAGLDTKRCRGAYDRLLEWCHNNGDKVSVGWSDTRLDVVREE